MNEETLIKFDYNIDQLQAIAEEAKAIDTNNIEELETTTKALVKARGIIQKQGKSYRDDANAYNKMVLEKEKEYVQIIEPIELEYKALIEQHKQNLILEVRKEMLPMKKEQLALLTTLNPFIDEYLLSLDDTQWVEFYQRCMADNKQNLEREEQQKIDEANKAEREAQIAKDAEEKARLEFEAEQNRKAQQEEFAKQQAALKAKEEKEKLESDKRYKDFLSENSFNEVTDRVVEKDGVVRLYRLVAEYTK